MATIARSLSTKSRLRTRGPLSTITVITSHQVHTTARLALHVPTHWQPLAHRGLVVRWVVLLTVPCTVNSVAWAPHEHGLILACASSDGKASILTHKGKQQLSEHQLDDVRPSLTLCVCVRL